MKLKKKQLAMAVKGTSQRSPIQVLTPFMYSGQDRGGSSRPYFIIVKVKSENMQNYSIFVDICMHLKKREKRNYNSQFYISRSGISYELILFTS